MFVEFTPSLSHLSPPPPTHTSKEILILASDKSESGQTTVWRGRIKSSVGLFHFTPDSSLIATTVYPNSLQTSPADDRRTVVVVSMNRQFIFVSRTAGDTWDMYKTPSSDFDPEEELYLSSRDPRHMIVRSNKGTVCIVSRDLSVVCHVTSSFCSCLYQRMLARIGTMWLIAYNW